MEGQTNTAIADDKHIGSQADSPSEQSDARGDNQNGTHNSAQPQSSLRPGEAGFTAFILIASAFFVYRSILLYIDKPGLDGPAIIPLISSGAVALLALAEFIRLRANARGSKREKLKAAAARARRFLVPVNVAAALISIVVYCALIKLGAPFYLVTPVFLWGLMTFFSKGGYLKNLLWTALCMASIYTVFNLLLGVILP